MSGTTLRGRLVLEDGVTPGELAIEGGLIVGVRPDDGAEAGPLILPGFIDVHVHGWGGHSAMAGRAGLDGMARALLRHGVTSFLPTAWSEPMGRLAEFAAEVRAWLPTAPEDGATPLGFNLEGPFLSEAKKGAHEAAHLRAPAEVDAADVEPLLDGLSLITIAPELPGALELIRTVVARGGRVSLGHSAATVAEAAAGYAAGATSTTHLFNGMSGVDHHRPGLAVAALGNDAAYVELIADGHHVDPSLFPLITRTKPPDRLMLVSDGVSIAGTGEGRTRLGAIEVELAGGRVTIAGTSTLAGGAMAVGDAVRGLVERGLSWPAAATAASGNPARMLGATDRGRIAVGLRADLVELDEALRVRRVMRGGAWFGASG